MGTNNVSIINLKVFETIASIIRDSKNRHIILDNGCNGVYSELASLLLDSGIPVVGVDINLQWLIEKRKKFSHDNNLKVICADSHYLPFREKKFDIVVLVEVLEHLSSPNLALGEINRILNKDGKFILSTPNAIGLWSLFMDRALYFLRKIIYALKRKKLELEPFYHKHVFTLTLLLKILTDNGFKIKDIISFEGVGITKLFQTIFFMLKRFGFFQQLVVRAANLEIKACRIFPLSLHAGWIIIAVKDKLAIDLYNSERIRLLSKETQYIKQNLINNLKFINGKTLDLGCGWGYWTKVLENYCEYVIGLDVRDVFDRDRISSKLSFIIGNGFKLPFKDNSFDMVTFFEVLEHMDDEKGFLKEINRVLKTNGRILLSVPNRNRLGNLLKTTIGKPVKYPFFLGIDHYTKEDNEAQWHFREYIKSDLIKLLNKSGFKDIKIKGVGLGFDRFSVSVLPLIPEHIYRTWMGSAIKYESK